MLRPAHFEAEFERQEHTLVETASKKTAVPQNNTSVREDGTKRRTCIMNKHGKACRTVNTCKLSKAGTFEKTYETQKLWSPTQWAFDMLTLK